ncbi:MAG: four helix bundle protein [Gemmatimonadales bacterium]
MVRAGCQAALSISCMRDHRRLEAWKEARVVAVAVVGLSREHWRPWASALFAQLQRASLSVQLNIAEGVTYGDSPSYTRYLGIAYGSAVETGELLELLSDTGALPKDTCGELLARSGRSQRLLLGLLKRRRPLDAK